MHVNVHEKLGCQIAERQTDAFSRRMKTFHHLIDEPEDFFVLYVSLENRTQNVMIHAREELSDIAF